MYVIYPKRSNSQKLPLWQKKSSRSVFLGYNTTHSSDFPLVLNLTTGCISPRYHVVSDGTFSTVKYISDDEDFPVFCNSVSLDSFNDKVPLETRHSPVLRYEWLTPAEREEKHGFIQH